jgi:lysophospholipase L1-like esterase
VARELDLDHINLGFSDSARGDKAMAEYIASTPMSAFVYDYDHNAHNPQWLQDTHYPFYEIIRKAQPEIPIICMSRASMGKFNWPGRFENDEKRRLIIQETVRRAKENGDNNIYFIDGANAFGAPNPTDCFVDGTHPNDVGFHYMAKAVIPVLKEALHLD